MNEVNHSTSCIVLCCMGNLMCGYGTVTVRPTAYVSCVLYFENLLIFD